MLRRLGGFIKAVIVRTASAASGASKATTEHRPVETRARPQTGLADVGMDEFVRGGPGTGGLLGIPDGRGGGGIVGIPGSDDPNFIPGGGSPGGEGIDPGLGGLGGPKDLGGPHGGAFGGLGGRPGSGLGPDGGLYGGVNPLLGGTGGRGDDIRGPGVNAPTPGGSSPDFSGGIKGTTDANFGVSSWEIFGKAGGASFGVDDKGTFQPIGGALDYLGGMGKGPDKEGVNAEKKSQAEFRDMIEAGKKRGAEKGGSSKTGGSKDSGGKTEERKKSDDGKPSGSGGSSGTKDGGKTGSSGGTKDPDKTGGSGDDKGGDKGQGVDDEGSRHGRVPVSVEARRKAGAHADSEQGPRGPGGGWVDPAQDAKSRGGAGKTGGARKAGRAKGGTGKVTARNPAGGKKPGGGVIDPIDDEDGPTGGAQVKVPWQGLHDPARVSKELRNQARRKGV